MLEAIDLETTSLPKYEYNKTKITELSMVAVKRRHVLETRPGATPRVVHKFTMCFNPRRLIDPGSTETSGLCNELLEYETEFNINVFNAINGFLQCLEKPVCLVAQNGHAFDFPILKNHFEKLNVCLSDDMMCADSLHAFFDIFEEEKSRNTSGMDKNPDTECTIVGSYTINNNKKAKEKGIDQTLDTQFSGEIQISSSQVEKETTDSKQSFDETDDLYSQKLLKQQNETTPRHNKAGPKLHNKISKVKRNIFWGDSPKPKVSYKLKDIYERVFHHSGPEAHHAENDCIMAMEISVSVAKQFVDWIDNNHCAFTEVKPMRLGVPLGLLVLTGVLWGCTNPLIRQGTKGLRDVTATTWTGQVWAEVTFLLSNWKYVLPWLVNQGGSLSYLAAVQRAPLSVAVPTANSLAFVFTAITGVAIGADEPLDTRSIMGIVLIMLGTALCCYDTS